MAQDRFSNEKYVDWVKVKLSLQYAKEGLEPVTEQRVQTFHNSLSSRLQAPSSSSATGAPTLCHGCLKEDLKRQWSRQRFSCLGGICDGWLESLQQNHVNPTSTVEWDNFNVSQLPVSRWECAKVYLPYGSGKVQGAGDADLAAIMTLYLNCRHFASSLQDITLCEKVKEARNSILHSGSMEVDRAQMLSYVGLLKQLLHDPTFAADTACQAAVNKIDHLVRDKLELSLNKELELQALNGDIKSVVVKTDQLKQDMADLTSQVQQQTGQLRTDMTAKVSNLRGQVCTVTTEVANLRDQVGTATTEVSNLRGQVGTATTDMSNLRDQVGTATTEVSNLRDQVGTATTDMSNLRDQVGTATTEVSNLRDQVGTVTTDLSNLRDQVGTATTEVSNLRDQVGTATTDMSNLRDQVGTATTEVSNLRDQVGTVTTDLSNLRGQVGTVTTDLSNLRGQLGTHMCGADKEMANLQDKMEASMKEIVELQKVADLLCSFINACHIDKVDIGQLAASISTLSVLRAETDRQSQVLAQLQETVGRHDVILDRHGQEIGQLQDQMSHQMNIGHRDRQNPEVMDVTALQQYLVTVYQEDCNWENPLTTDEDKPATVSKMYVKPVIKILRERDQTTGLVKVQQSKTENPSKPISYKQVFFTNAQQCENIYITGNAGMGKTTFCRHIVQAWCRAIQNILDKDDSAEDIAVLKEFSLLFFLNLREVESHYHIEGMIRKNVLHNATTEYNVPDILKTEKCLVVLDGLDEWSCPQNVDICRGLNKGIPGRNTMNKNCTYLTTTRNWKFDVIDLKSKDCDKHVELCGIGNNSSKELAKKTLCRLDPEAKNTRPLNDFFKKVQEKNLTSLTNVPIILIQLITLWYFCKDLGKSQVQLYCKMLDLLLEQAKKHLLEKTATVTKPIQTDTKLPKCFTWEEGSCHRHAHLLFCLSKLAFTSLLNKKKEDSLVFKSSILEFCGIDSSDISLCLKCGIFTQTKVLDNPTGKYKKYSFLHKKLQEFLAAVYLVKGCDSDDSIGQVQEYCDKLETTLEMGQMMMFVCGMNAEVGNQLLEHLLSVVSEDTKVQNYRQSLDGVDLIKDIQTCVMACVTEGASNELKYDVHLQDYYIYCDTISDYINHVVEKKITSIKSVDIYPYQCSKEHVTAVLKHLQTVQTLEKLYLWDFRQVVSDRSILASVLASNASTLQSLNLLYVGLHDEALFAAVLRCVPSLRALGLLEEKKVDKSVLEEKKEKLEKELEEEDREKEDVVKRKKLVFEALEKIQESLVSHGQLEQLPATSHLTHLDLYLECSDHGKQCRPVLDLSHHTQLQTLELWYMCVTNLHAVAHSVEKVMLVYVTVAHSTLRQFIEALAQSSHKVGVLLVDVTVTEDSGDPADTAAYIRDCDKFTVEKCYIHQDDKKWDWVQFYKK